MTVRSAPAEVLDARLEAGLVCVICGRSVLRLAWTPPPCTSRWGELHYYEGTELIGPAEAKANPRADYITKVDQPRGSGWEYTLFFPFIYLEETVTYQWHKATR